MPKMPTYKTLVRKPLIHNPLGNGSLLSCKFGNKTEDGKTLFLGDKILTASPPHIRSSSSEASSLIAITVPKREPIWANTWIMSFFLQSQKNGRKDHMGFFVLQNLVYNHIMSSYREEDGPYARMKCTNQEREREREKDILTYSKPKNWPMRQLVYDKIGYLPNHQDTNKSKNIT